MTTEAYASLLYYLGETQTSILCDISTTSSGQLYVTKTEDTNDAIDKFAKAINLLTEGKGFVRLQLEVMDSNNYDYDDPDVETPEPPMYLMWATWEGGSMSPMMVDYLFPDYCCVDKSTLKY
jgi:hypothetical protein